MEGKRSNHLTSYSLVTITSRDKGYGRKQEEQLSDPVLTIRKAINEVKRTVKNDLTRLFPFLFIAEL